MNFLSVKNIGQIEPVCPYCNKRYSKMPTRSCKCKNCGEKIKVRKRLSDGNRVILKVSEVEKLERQHSIRRLLKRTLQDVNAEFELRKIADIAKNVDGRIISQADALWSLFSKRSLDYMKQQRWSAFSGNQIEMSELLAAEGKYSRAISPLSISLYLEANGGVARDWPDNFLQRKGRKRWNPSESFLGRYHLYLLRELAHNTNKDVGALYPEFNVATLPYFEGGFGISLSPEKAWANILNAEMNLD